MNLKLNNHQFFVKLMKTPKEIKNGMMFKTFNYPHNGMLFLLQNNKHCFWMKNCIIPLDIIFIKDGKVTKIYDNCKPCIAFDCKSYCGDGNMVLEVEGGTCMDKNIIEGDLLEIID